ncbi:MAG: hypothetical protein J4F30_07615 [Acidobacteria bacterium]|nr:hypothetical protein [Acidobacteriota bacterium]
MPVRSPACSRRVAVVLCAVIWSAAPAGAQTLGGVRPVPHAPPARGVLTAWHTTLDAVHLAGSDAGPRFDWDIDFRFDADLIDLGFVRANVLAQVETIVGSELRDVDPNQNNYTADFTLFFRLPRGELGAMFHHVSRHLADRADQGSISWNMVGVSYDERFTVGPARVDAGVRAMGTTERAGVDYTAQVEWYGALELPLNPRLAIIGMADGVVAPVERGMFGRGARRGGRLAGGVRIPSAAGAVDLYAGWEQRIDAGQFTRETTRWLQAGVRMTVPAP